MIIKCPDTVNANDILFLSAIDYGRGFFEIPVGWTLYSSELNDLFSSFHFWKRASTNEQNFEIRNNSHGFKRWEMYCSKDGTVLKRVK